MRALRRRDCARGKRASRHKYSNFERPTLAARTAGRARRPGQGLGSSRGGRRRRGQVARRGGWAAAVQPDLCAVELRGRLGRVCSGSLRPRGVAAKLGASARGRLRPRSAAGGYAVAAWEVPAAWRKVDLGVALMPASCLAGGGCPRPGARTDGFRSAAGPRQPTRPGGHTGTDPKPPVNDQSAHVDWQRAGLMSQEVV
jgi:hypothetical protein